MQQSNRRDYGCTTHVKEKQQQQQKDQLVIYICTPIHTPVLNMD